MSGYFDDNAYIGEIRMFAGGFAPSGWRFCDGAMLKISDYQQLFSVLGFQYGGDAATQFGLPDLRGRIPIGRGKGDQKGMSFHPLSETKGSETVTLTVANMPPHRHGFYATSVAADLQSPENAQPASISGGFNDGFYSIESKGTKVAFASGFLDNAFGENGRATPHTNVMPSKAVNFIIAVVGEYPDHEPPQPGLRHPRF